MDIYIDKYLSYQYIYNTYLKRAQRAHPCFFPHQEVAADPRETSFFRALNLSEGVAGKQPGTDEGLVNLVVVNDPFFITVFFLTDNINGLYGYTMVIYGYNMFDIYN